jgi:NAD(P)H-dependent FMN reductase
MKILVVLGSARQNGLGQRVGKWVHGVSAADTEHETEVVSVAELNLPLFNENFSPKYRHYTGSEYTNAEGKAWAERVAGADAFVFVTPEYNHSIPAALKNALHWVGSEWADKPVGFVGYSITRPSSGAI